MIPEQVPIFFNVTNRGRVAILLMRPKKFKFLVTKKCRKKIAIKLNIDHYLAYTITGNHIALIRRELIKMISTFTNRSVLLIGIMFFVIPACSSKLEVETVSSPSARTGTLSTDKSEVKPSNIPNNSTDPQKENKVSVEVITDDTNNLPEIISLEPLAARPGEIVRVTGKNMEKLGPLTVSIGEKMVPLAIAPDGSYEFVMPDDLKAGQVDVSLVFVPPTSTDPRIPTPGFSGKFGNKATLLVDPGDYPIFTSTPDKVCNDITYRNARGEVIQGTKNCGVSTGPLPNGVLVTCSKEGETSCVTTDAFRATSVKGLAAKIILGANVAGIDGVAEAYKGCSADGQTGCVVVGPTYAAAVTAGAASKILSGQTLAGIAGNVTLPAGGKVLTGTSFGVSGTGSSGSLTLPTASNVRSGTGAYGDPGAALTPSYSPDFPDVANVRAVDTVDGATGTLSDCAAGGASGCVATATYKTMNLTAAGTAASLTGANFNTTIAAAGNFEFWDASGSRYSVAGDTDLTASNVLSGKNIFGVDGSITGGPTYCTSDGEAGCVVVGPTYAAAVTAGAASKILSGQTLAGITGNVTLPAGGKVLTGTSFGVSGTGSSGTLTLPTASNVRSGTGAYGDPGAALTPSYSPDFPDVANVRAVDTVDGATGSLSDCAAGGASGCVATATYKTMNLTAAGTAASLTGANFNTTIAAAGNFEFWDASGSRYSVAGDTDLTAGNVLSGKNIFGVDGSVVAAPSNCTSNGSQSCVATGSYYAATSCAANSSNCFLPTYVTTTQPLRAISYDAINSGKSSMRTSLTLGGIAGTLPDCTSNGATGCVTTATYKSGDLTNLAAGNVRRGISIAGTTGNFPSATSPLPRFVDSGASTTTTGSDITDLTTFSTQVLSNSQFEFWSSSGVRAVGNGDSDILAANIKSGISIFSTTGSLLGQGANGTPMLSTVNGTNGGPDRINLNWTAGGGSEGAYLVVMGTSTITWSPTNLFNYTVGQSLGGGQSVVYYGTGTSTTVTGLTQGTAYYFKVFPIEIQGYYGSGIAQTIATSSCGSGGGSYSGACWYKSTVDTTCNSFCSTRGGANSLTCSFAAASTANCQTVVAAIPHAIYATDTAGSANTGCGLRDAGGPGWYIRMSVGSCSLTATAGNGSHQVCACAN